MPPVKVVFAVADCGTATSDGLEVTLREGDVWAADDPLVLLRPQLFSDDPPGPRYPRRTAPAVEQATRAPGERRGEKRG